jgi:glycosyltransferase involved in cell wall biosynthesis
MLDYQIPRPHVVMNAPVMLKNIKSSHNLRDMIGLRNSDALAVYVGSVTINRGLDFAIRALQYCSDLHLAMVGPRRPQTHEELEILADKFNVSNRIHFIDPVNPKEVVGFIKTANVSVIPIQNVCLSYYYSMPNKLLESVFAGIPVVVSNLIEIKRFVQRYRCGEVMDETNPESIAEAIEKVINHSDKYKIPANLMADLNRCYSWESQAERLKKIYASFRNLT